MLRVEIEGIDGSGKTTLLNNIAKSLGNMGFRVGLTREVGNTHDAAAVKLREVILNPDHRMDGKEMELVFGAMRLMNQRWLKENKDQYDIILNDRGILSHYAYTDHNVSTEFTKQFYAGFLTNYTELADIVLRVKVAPEVALARRNKRNGFVDAIEAKGPGYQQLVSESMDKYIEAHYNSTSRASAKLANMAVVEIDGHKSAEEMAIDATAIIFDLYNNSVDR